jgi:ribonuclease Z
MPLPLAEYDYQGIGLLGSSLAGEETFVVVSSLNLAFDLGRAPREVVNTDNVFLTHGHMDHAAGIAYYFAQRKFLDQEPGHLYVPGLLVDPIRRLLRVWADIDHEPPANIHPAIPGEDISLRRDLIVRPFAVNHPSRRPDGRIVEGLGFAAIEVRRKLKDEFHDLTGPQIVEMKKKGVEITRRVEIPLVAYCGDTAPGGFLELECVRNAKILLIECTFVEADHQDRARAGFHMHISDLTNVLSRLNNDRVVLTHLSRRTVLPEARSLLRRELGAQADERVTFLMDSRPRGRRAARGATDRESQPSSR